MSDDVKTEVATVARRAEVTAFNANDPVALYMNTGMFEQLQRVATLLSKASLVPKHLQDKAADCFLVVSQAFRWGMDPFAVAQCTFVLSGKLGYEGKLIAAVVNVSGKLAAPLNYEYSGTAKNRMVVVSGQFKSEGKPRTIDGTVGGWETQNPKWKEMPDQMLAYRGAREWARRHMPEAVLGVQSSDEVEDVAQVIDVTPTITTTGPKLGLDPLKEKLRAEAEAKRGEPSKVEQMSVDLIRAAVNDLASKAGVPPLDPDADDAEKETATPLVHVPPGKRKDDSTCMHESLRGARVGVAKKRACPECDVELSQAQCDALGPV